MNRVVSTALLLLVAGCSNDVPDPEADALYKEFERDRVIVATCPPPEGYATTRPERVYRFRGDLVIEEYSRRNRIRKIEAATPENICDKLQSKKVESGEGQQAPTLTKEGQQAPMLANLTLGTVLEWFGQIWKTISRR